MIKESKHVRASFFGVSDALFTHLVITLDEKEASAVIVYIQVKEQHKGHFRELIAAIEQAGYRCLIYYPGDRTRAIITQMDFIPISNELWARRVFDRKV